MTLYQHNENPNAFVRFFRRVYNPIGFHKGYNFILFFIAAGYMFGFGLARLEYLSIDGVFKSHAMPGEWYYIGNILSYHVGIALHLCVVVPTALLCVFQFVPVIRYKAILFHRINGYVCAVLLLLANATALMIARHAFEGTLATQAFVGALAIGTTLGLFMAIYNIKRLQIDQHRAWMLRTWVWAGSIITLRLIMVSSASIISGMRSYWFTEPCQKIAYIAGEREMNLYAACRADPNGYASVNANVNGRVEEVVAAFNMSFGMAGLLAFGLHVIFVEVYLALTPAETKRLKQVSYERQVNKGMKHPGMAGLVSARLGDAEAFVPAAQKLDT